MSARGVDEIAQARQWFNWWSKRVVPPVTPGTRKSLHRLAKALDGLDPAARLHLGMALERPDAIDSVRAGVDTCLTSATIKRGRKSSGIEYMLGIKFLVLAWVADHRCSPLTRWKEFQDFAGGITKDYGAPTPGEKHVRRWLKGRHRT